MKTILAIDDEKGVCESIRLAFENEYQVISALSGNKGMDVLRKKAVSLVLLDYRLPDTDGLELLVAIKENYNIPVIMMTGHGSKEVVLSSWRRKADHYVDKPFDMEELGNKIKELLGETFPYVVLGLDRDLLSSDVQRALEFIGSNVSAPSGIPKMTLNEISAVPSITPNHLLTLFKKECRMGYPSDG